MAAWWFIVEWGHTRAMDCADGWLVAVYDVDLVKRLWKQFYGTLDQQ